MVVRNGESGVVDGERRNIAILSVERASASRVVSVEQRLIAIFDTILYFNVGLEEFCNKDRYEKTAVIPWRKNFADIFIRFDIIPVQCIEDCWTVGIAISISRVAFINERDCVISIARKTIIIGLTTTTI